MFKFIKLDKFVLPRVMLPEYIRARLPDRLRRIAKNRMNRYEIEMDEKMSVAESERKGTCPHGSGK